MEEGDRRHWPALPREIAGDPFSGYLFIFRTRRSTAIRVLQYDGQGFWLATKRLIQGAVSMVAGTEAPANRCERIRRNCCWRPAILTRVRAAPMWRRFNL